MRDAEVGDIYGDGSAAIAVATHDQGVVAVVRPDGSGGFSVDELDATPNTIVHEIEIGDLDGDGTLEVYATPSPPNEWCFRHQLLLPRPYLVLTKPLRLGIQCQRAASVKIGWKYLDD